MRKGNLVALGSLALGIVATDAPAQSNPAVVVRMAELDIDPAQLEQFKVAVKEEMADAVRLEPGVLAIYAVAEKSNPNRLRFFEIYASEAAYRSHLESPQFRKYAAITASMIRAKTLIETVPVQLSAKER